MADVTFRMVNDRTGEEVRASMSDEADYRAQGYRVVDTGLYQSAVGAIEDARRVQVPPTAEQEAAARQTYEDAVRVASGGGTEGDANFQRVGAEGGPMSTAPVGSEQYARDTYEGATVDKLKQYAKSEGIDLQGATLKADIVDALIAADKEAGRIQDPSTQDEGATTEE